MIVGLTLVADELGSRRWSVTLGSATLFYGVLGVLYLHVWMDVVLVAGALAVLYDGALQRKTTPSGGARRHARCSVGRLEVPR